MKPLLLLLLISSNLYSQDSAFVTIKAGNRIMDVLPPAEIFSHPEFANGKVFFRNGVVAAAKMTYNSLSDQMMFIDTHGDTLVLTEEKTINFIALDKDTFYYLNGYIRLVASNSGMKLAEKKVWQTADVRKMGSHNRPANTYAVTSQGRITDGFGRTYSLVQEEDIVLKRKVLYFFGDEYNRFVPAGRKNLLAFFPKNETSLANYLKENKVHYDKGPDLVKLLQFLGQGY